ncbi:MULTISPECIES: SUMF1/EgtB/PvdO family nonheme iron enzyme [unclassified Pseudoalteromonas]|uniref:SUMF1/EgtB/PvdO family nonheme iron enzyme n=1 Tax=unclassified Pseudoalteromonas TaxID=194690 RepID=UPI002097E35D|nr:SUMF1/EgtB/PvdO family nonheme iron enzyme [Pseudoalteromonas sp. XMcav2-N]MCO7189761.1 SUMF1/EgtB/PvdO family nonheme iron enzyme [Pseudoalteromonas sp. XMcav2-N]
MKITLPCSTLILLTICSPTLAGNSPSPIEPIMVTLPAGSFAMGSSDNENSQPVHSVTLPEFSLGKYEVTVREYRRFVEATGFVAPQECYHQLDGWFIGNTPGSWDNNSLTDNDFQPAICVSWTGAKAYVDWLAKTTGKPYRLPSEAEWEYAAHGGTTSGFYFGDDPKHPSVCQYENTADLSGENELQRTTNSTYVNFVDGFADCVDHATYASVVGMYQPNPYGLHDMLSNVAEILGDCYQDNYQQASENGRAFQSGQCERRSVRGSSWHWNIWPVTRRGSMPEDFAGAAEGFRVALDGPAPKQSKASRRFQQQLIMVQKQEQRRRDQQFAYPQPVTNLTLSQNNGYATLSWDRSTQKDISGYRIYRNHSAGSMFELIADNVIDTQFTDANASPNVYEYTVVAVRRNLQSNYSNLVKTSGKALSVPGRIEAEYAYAVTGANTARTSDTDGRLNLTGGDGIAEDAQLDYQINVSKSGYYRLSYRIAGPRNGKGFTVKIDGKPISAHTVRGTGGYNDWQTQQGERIYLAAGKHTLKLHSHDTNWKLNWLALHQE